MSLVVFFQGSNPFAKYSFKTFERCLKVFDVLSAGGILIPIKTTFQDQSKL